MKLRVVELHRYAPQDLDDTHLSADCAPAVVRSRVIDPPSCTGPENRRTNLALTSPFTTVTFIASAGGARAARLRGHDEDRLG